MNTETETTTTHHKGRHGTVATYTTGFISSILLTLGAYTIVVFRALGGAILVFTIVALGLVQLFVQLLFFLHLGQGPKPRWNLTIFFFALLIVAIMVGGSLWIMYNINYNMMPLPVNSVQDYLINQ